MKVLYSINRPHTDNIKSGRKLWEMRKTKPNILVPFTSFIYETKKKGGCGKVIGEFICDETYTIKPDFEYYSYGYDIDDDMLLETCLTQEELKEYGKGKTLYGLHISDLKIYDKPKELSEFKVACNPKLCLSGCESVHLDNCFRCINQGNRRLTRPPQSWCYVEE